MYCLHYVRSHQSTFLSGGKISKSQAFWSEEAIYIKGYFMHVKWDYKGDASTNAWYK